MKIFKLITISLLLLITTMSLYAQDSKDTTTTLTPVANYLEKIHRDDLEKKQDRIFSIYDHRLEDVQSGVQKYLELNRQETDTKITSLENQFHLALILFAFAGFVLTWISFKTIGAWVQSQIEKQVISAINQDKIEEISKPILTNLIDTLKIDGEAVIQSLKENHDNFRALHASAEEQFKTLASSVSNYASESKDFLGANERSDEAPVLSNPLLELANNEFLADNYELAFGAAEKAFSFKQDLDAAKLAARSAVALGKGAEAEIYFKLAKNIDPNDSKNLSSYAGFLYKDPNRVLEAEDLLRHAIEVSPNYAYPKYLLARILFDKGQFEEAEILYRKHIELDPNNSHVLADFADFLYKKLDKGSEAKDVFEKAVVIEDVSAFVLARYALFAERELKNYTEAENYFKKALDKEFTRFAIISYSMFLDNVKKDPKAEKKLLDKALITYPNWEWAIKKLKFIDSILTA